MKANWDLFAKENPYTSDDEEIVISRCPGRAFDVNEQDQHELWLCNFKQCKDDTDVQAFINSFGIPYYPRNSGTMEDKYATLEVKEFLSVAGFYQWIDSIIYKIHQFPGELGNDIIRIDESTYSFLNSWTIVYGGSAQVSVEYRARAIHEASMGRGELKSEPEKSALREAKGEQYRIWFQPTDFNVLTGECCIKDQRLYAAHDVSLTEDPEPSLHEIKPNSLSIPISRSQYEALPEPEVVCAKMYVSKLLNSILKFVRPITAIEEMDGSYVARQSIQAQTPIEAMALALLRKLIDTNQIGYCLICRTPIDKSKRSDRYYCDRSACRRKGLRRIGRVRG